MSQKSPYLRPEDDAYITRLALAVRRAAQVGGLDTKAFVKLVEELGEPFSWRRLDAWLRHPSVSKSSWHFPLPPALLEVCRGLARHQGRRFRVALDPWSETGLLLRALSDEGIISSGEGWRVSPLADLFPVDTRLVFNEGPAQVPARPSVSEFELYGPDPDYLDEYPELVVCMPPWGLPAREDDARNPWAVRLLENQLLLAASRQLHRTGAAVFLMPPAFWHGRDGERTRETLWQESGYRCVASFYLPPGSVKPGLALGGYIVIFCTVHQRAFDNHDDGSMFVAELDSSAARTAAVMESLMAQQEGQTIGLGRVVRRDAFQGFPCLIDQAAIESYERQRPGELVALSSLARSIGPAREPIEAGPDRLFVSLVQHVRVVATTSPEDITGDLRSWATVDLDPGRAAASYIAHWLHTNIGKTARRSLMRGAVAPRLPLSSLGSVMIHAPSLGEQNQRLTLIARAEDLANLTAGVRAKCCDADSSVESLESQLESLLRPDSRMESLEVWAETLPFPLASVLRRYKRESSDSERAAGALLHFFEAFSEFWATILLSALDRVDGIPGPTSKQLRSYLAEHRLHPLERSTMATWILVGGKIASALQKRFLGVSKQVLAPRDNGQEAEDPLTALVTRNTATLEALLSSRISTVLQRANELRNNSKGHGGALGEGAATLLHQELLALLSNLRNLVAPAFEKVRLFRLGSLTIHRGLLTYDAEVLQGSNATFLKEPLVLEEPCDTNALVICAGERRALPLVPLIRMAAPKGGDTACYFYNRCVPGSARFVSYHQGNNAEDESAAPLEFIDRWNGEDSEK